MAGMVVGTSKLMVHVYEVPTTVGHDGLIALQAVKLKKLI
jgi:hypothetical protein